MVISMSTIAVYIYSQLPKHRMDITICWKAAAYD